MAERDTSHQDQEVFEKTLQELMAQGVDRRIADSPDYHGPERRQGPRRKLDRLPDKPIKR